MKDWNWIAQRRRLSLENFLSDTNTIEAALEKFSKLDIIPPERKILERFFNENTAPKTPQTKIVEEQKSEDLNQLPNSEYDDLVIIETEES